MSDVAKYPFIPEALEKLRMLDFRLEDILKPDYAPIIDRAEKRIIEALTSNPPEVFYDPRKYDEDVEILSFPVAIGMVSALSNEYVKKRYALAEARRAYNLLKVEDKDKIIMIAKKFGWRIKVCDRKVGFEKFDFALHFIDYLRNASSFRERDWKLVNRLVINGEVYLSKQDVARLLQEEVRRYIEAKIDPKIRSSLPEKIIERVEKLRRLHADKIRESLITDVDFSASNIESSAFPPCIRELYEAAIKGRPMPHMGRFTLTAFLLRIGMDPNTIVDIFRKFADFNERMTQYQVEHIAGQRGSGTKYTPPKCDTLQTYGLCPGMDDLCKKVRHPLTYYMRKMRKIGEKRREESK